MMEKTIRRYSIAFKKQVVREYEKGQSLTWLCEKYGIGACKTVSQWIKQHSVKGLRHQLMIIQTVDEQSQVKALQQRIGELEKALAQVTLDKLMLASIVAEAESQYGLALKKTVEQPALSARR
jgi:transposase-like protein